jgi:NCAIR mutase (PurE)-related protein
VAARTLCSTPSQSAMRASRAPIAAADASRQRASSSPQSCARSAGTSDAPAVREAQVRAELLGAHVVVQRDVGVAGLHRLVAALPDLDRADCVVVVAGQDAALASVVGGLVSTPIIAVPTSTGYGASFGGVSALLAMITSCAAGVAVVNIDDGFGAGTIAARIARAAAGVTATGSAHRALAPVGEPDGR